MSAPAGGGIAIGDRIGGCNILARIGAGEAGTVYRVWYENLQREQVLKVLHAHWTRSPEVVKRFVREAKLAARIDHPRVVRTFDVGRDGGHYYIRLSFHDGPTLSQWLRNNPTAPMETRVRLARDLADGLRAVHASSVLLRDLKPDNVIVERIDGVERARIIDFGVAARETGPQTVSWSGEMLGTFAVLAPELEDGGAPSPATDVYALGMVFASLIGAGALIPPGDPLDRISARKRAEDWAPPWPNGGPFAPLVLAMVRRDPVDRERELALVAAALSDASGPQTPPPVRTGVLPSRIAAAIGAVLIVAAALSGSGSAPESSPTPALGATSGSTPPRTPAPATPTPTVEEACECPPELIPVLLDAVGTQAADADFERLRGLALRACARHRAVVQSSLAEMERERNVRQLRDLRGWIDRVRGHSEPAPAEIQQLTASMPHLPATTHTWRAIEDAVRARDGLEGRLAALRDDALQRFAAALARRDTEAAGHLRITELAPVHAIAATDEFDLAKFHDEADPATGRDAVVALRHVLERRWAVWDTAGALSIAEAFTLADPPAGSTDAVREEAARMRETGESLIAAARLAALGPRIAMCGADWMRDNGRKLRPPGTGEFPVLGYHLRPGADEANPQWDDIVLELDLTGAGQGRWDVGARRFDAAQVMTLLSNGASSTASPPGSAAAVAWLGTVLPGSGWDEGQAVRQVNRDPQRVGAEHVNRLGPRHWRAASAAEALANATAAAANGDYAVASRLAAKFTADYADTPLLDDAAVRAQLTVLRVTAKRAATVDWSAELARIYDGPGRTEAAILDANRMQVRWWPARETDTPWSPGPWRRTGSAALMDGVLRVGSVGERGTWIHNPLLRGAASVELTLAPAVAGALAVEWAPLGGTPVGFGLDVRNAAGLPRTGLYTGDIEAAHSWQAPAAVPRDADAPLTVSLSIAADLVTVSIDGRIVATAAGVSAGAGQFRIRTLGPSEWRVTTIAVTGRLAVEQIP